MATRWEDVEELFVRSAADDLGRRGEARPALAAFAGARLRFLAWLRPFPRGAYHAPLVELFALAAPLDVDRLALAMPGKAWSLNDPIPPVSADADLRQRILLIHVVDGAGGRPRAVSVLHPFDEGDGVVSWQEPTRLEGGQGWIIEAMDLTIRRRARLRATDQQIREQAVRVSALGHDLYLASELRARLGQRSQRT